MKPIKVEEIKKRLLDLHEREGFKIFGSFPVLSADPTVLFVNATITPFKHLFYSKTATSDFALIQRCFRAGGSQSLRHVGYDPNLSSFFEMFGTGSFATNCRDATKHLFNVFEVLGIMADRLYFTVPSGDDFRGALVSVGVAPERIFAIENNEKFWCHWQFGPGGLTGRGLTAICARTEKKAVSLDQLRSNPEEFTELLNLIHIYGVQSDDLTIVPAANPGYEIGVGIGRLASILQNCNGYEVDNVAPLVEVVAGFYEKSRYNGDAGTYRAATDCLQSTVILMDEGLIPSNKGANYVLRKMIRRLLELIWFAANEPIDLTPLVVAFYDKFTELNKSIEIQLAEVAGAVKTEQELLNDVLGKGAQIMKKKPGISAEILRDTYGLSTPLAKLAERIKV